MKGNVLGSAFSRAAAAAAAFSLRLAIAVSAASYRRPCLASAAAALDAVVLAMLLIVVKPTPNVDVVFVCVQNLTHLARGPGELFFWNHAWPGAHPCRSALPPTGNARRVGGGSRRGFLG